MRIFLIAESGPIRVYKSKYPYSIFEGFDGYHTITQRAILHCQDGIYDDKIVFFAESLTPMGISETSEIITNTCAIYETIKMYRHKININKKISRFLDALSDNINIVVIGGMFLIAILAMVLA